MIKLTTEQALHSLLVHDVYLWKWLEADLTKVYRRKLRSQLLKGTISVGLQQKLLLSCGYTIASELGWYHADYSQSMKSNYPTDWAFAILTSSDYLWAATRQDFGLRRYYRHCIKTNKPVGLSTKVKLLTSAGFVMQPPTWHYPAWPTKTRNRSFSTFHKQISIAD